MIMKKSIIFLGFVLLSAMILTIGIYEYYYYSMKSANREHYEKWLKEDFLIDSYTGTVSEIQSFNNDFYVITISVPNQNDRVYNWCEKKIDIRNGDIIVKENNNFNLYKVHNGMKILLKYNFCKD